MLLNATLRLSLKEKDLEVLMQKLPVSRTIRDALTAGIWFHKSIETILRQVFSEYKTRRHAFL
jgi:hypothetical protein